MEQPPRSPLEQLISTPQFVLGITQGMLVTLITASYYWWTLSNGYTAEVARILAFIVLVTANATLIFPSRTAQTGWREMFTGLSSVGAFVLGGTMLGLILITSVPVIAEAFTFRPPSVPQWLLAFSIGIAMIFLFEAAKVVLHRRN